MEYIKKIIKDNYIFNVVEIIKSTESTVGNVYIVYTNDTKYVLKIYDSLNHTESMTLLHDDLSNKFDIPKIIYTKDGNRYVKNENKYYVLYSFLEGIQIGKFGKLDSNIVKQIALELRKIHDLTSVNKYKLDECNLCRNSNIKRKSLLHFDLTKGNIFYNEGKDSIGFIDFDDAKYGQSICDVAILITLLFISKKRGIDNDNIKLFIDSYYGDDIKLKNEEIKFIKEIAINWINLTLENNEFNPSTNESFEVKKKLIEENLHFDFIKLIPLRECINKKLYDMYQDIPGKEIGSINKLKDVTYNEFLKIINEYIEEETKINKELNTTTVRYILHVNNIPVGEVGVRTTINDYWENKGSQIYYKISLSKRGNKYGSIMFKLALEEVRKLGFKKIRINCDNNNLASKKIILNNGGKRDIIDYKTEDGVSTSYLIYL